jgi:predicted dehydrogenase
MSGKSIRWGIVGAGHIAQKFAHDLRYVAGARLSAVASRDKAKAFAFIKSLDKEYPGQDLSCVRAYGSYEELASASDIDAVYIATPHPWHAENAILCLRGGKHALVEKPFAVNLKDGQRLAQAARDTGLFCMEAVWTRFLPAIQELRRLIGAGELGEIQMVTADFGFHADYNPDGRLFSPELAGGSLLDVGIYPLNFARMVFGRPFEEVRGYASLSPMGVDESAVMAARFSGNGMASLACGLCVETSKSAYVLGTEGRAVLPLFWMAREMETQKGKADPVKRQFDFPGFGYQFEAEEVSLALAHGQSESTVMPLSETLEILGVMDDLRRQWGLKYPFEG